MFPDECYQINYTINYEEENNMTCNSHSNFFAEVEQKELSGTFEMQCLGWCKSIQFLPLMF